MPATAWRLPGRLRRPREHFDLAKVHAVKPPADWQLNTHISLRNRYVFFQVCKAASSTVVQHLQTLEYAGTHYKVRDVFNKHLSPHLSPYQLPPSQLAGIMHDPSWRRVTFVRNPFTRLLSAYLHRIVAAPDSPSARAFRKASGDSGTPSFERFVVVVCSQSSFQMERHWRVQADEVLADLVPLTFIGRMESLSHDLGRLSDHLLGGGGAFDPTAVHEVNASPMQTNAATRLHEYYTAELIELVVRRFRRDFDLFGYPTTLPC